MILWDQDHVEMILASSPDPLIQRGEVRGRRRSGGDWVVGSLGTLKYKATIKFKQTWCLWGTKLHQSKFKFGLLCFCVQRYPPTSLQKCSYLWDVTSSYLSPPPITFSFLSFFEYVLSNPYSRNIGPVSSLNFTVSGLHKEYGSFIFSTGVVYWCEEEITNASLCARVCACVRVYWPQSFSPWTG